MINTHTHIYINRSTNLSIKLFSFKKKTTAFVFAIVFPLRPNIIMKLSTLFTLATTISTLTTFTIASPVVVVEKRAINETALAEDIPTTKNNHAQTSYGKPFAIYQPKAFIISMFSLERDPWLKAMDFVHNITIPGLSPVYPDIHCTTNYTICQITTGEGEINAASSISALTLNPLFDLTKTYF